MSRAEAEQAMVKAAERYGAALVELDAAKAEFAAATKAHTDSCFAEWMADPKAAAPTPA